MKTRFLRGEYFSPWLCEREKPMDEGEKKEENQRKVGNYRENGKLESWTIYKTSESWITDKKKPGLITGYAG